MAQKLQSKFQQGKSYQLAIEQFTKDKNNLCDICHENFKALYCELCNTQTCIACSIAKHQSNPEMAKHKRVNIQFVPVFESKETAETAIVEAVAHKGKRGQLPTPIQSFTPMINRAPLPEAVPEEKWVQDRQRSSCSGCNSQFSFFFRRHHCRLCGEVFCRHCANQYVELTVITTGKKDQDVPEEVVSIERVCSSCAEQYRKQRFYK